MPQDPTKTAPLGNNLCERHPEIFEPSMRGVGAGRGTGGKMSRAQFSDVETRIDRMGKRKDFRKWLRRHLPGPGKLLLPAAFYLPR